MRRDSRCMRACADPTCARLRCPTDPPHSHSARIDRPLPPRSSPTVRVAASFSLPCPELARSAPLALAPLALPVLPAPALLVPLSLAPALAAAAAMVVTLLQAATSRRAAV